MLTSAQLRQKYLDFFASKGHTIIPSASLIPENDPTTLFNSSGMQPLIPYLLGEKHPEGNRLTDSQKSFRTQDIEEVGDSRHTTFFEMLGNWSLGDYFKEHQLPWIVEFVTKELELDPERLYFTCFRGNKEIGVPKDEVSANLIQEEFKKAGIDAKIVDNQEAGMQGGRIFYYDETKNWWSRSGVPVDMPIGEPGGPDAEMFWDFGENLGLHEKSGWKNMPCHVNCDCGRFVEIGNSVFMEYIKTEKGFEPLKQKNVDFGGGLERMAMAVQGVYDIFEIDIMQPVIKIIEKISGKTYGASEEDKKAFRVITDHLRAATFLIADGATPSNKDQGYFTRRLLRRAIRFANKLGIKDNFCSDIANNIIESYKEQYNNLEENKQKILSELKNEEEKFGKTLEEGLKELEKLIKKKQKEMESATAVRFPPKDLNKVSGYTLNAITPKEAFDLYQTYGFPLELINEELAQYALFISEEEFKIEFAKHQDLSRAGAEQKFKGGLADTSEISTKYHTATHLLHAALRKVLGEHVAQKGSNITAERLRFDFSHPEKMTDDQKKAVEDLVNAAIKKDYPVTFSEMIVSEAKAKGAIGLFEDKYGAKVKVYSVGDPEEMPKAKVNSPTFSKEICGGPHVERTGTMGNFKIIKEEAVSAGVRRIKAALN